MKAIIYSRVSSIGERQNTERQIADLEKYASDNGIDVVRVFSEKISGAKKNNERGILMAAFDFAKSQNIDVILCSELSRFGRAIWEVLEGVKYCVDNGIDVFFQKENLHILNENKEVDAIMAIYISCLGFAAEFERKSIQFRLNSGRKLAIERGVKLGRKVGSVKTKEEYKEQYREVISLLRKGLSVAIVADICKQRGIKASSSTVKMVKKKFLQK